MSEVRPEDRTHMARALALAARGRGTVSPNPMVGAVVVQGGEVVGEGYHQRAGEPHAEVHALRAAGEAARGADLYVTLEPCCFTGRTGACTDLVLASGVRRVVVGAIDPNPRVSGQGIALLRRAGIEVVSGVLGDACAALNEVFNHWIVARTPFVTLKLATSLDGRIAAAGGASRWITGPEARAEVHALRATHDGVMVGIETALADDPRLDVRDFAPPHGALRQPVRVVVDSRLRLPPTARLLEGAAEVGVIVATVAPEDDPRARALRARGAEVWSLPADDGRVALGPLLERLGRREGRPVASLLVEGGGRLAGSLVRAGLAHRVQLYLAPFLMGADGVPAVGPLGLGAPGEAPRLQVTEVRRVGEDLAISARFPARLPE